MGTSEAINVDAAQLIRVVTNESVERRPPPRHKATGAFIPQQQQQQHQQQQQQQQQQHDSTRGDSRPPAQPEQQTISGKRNKTRKIKKKELINKSIQPHWRERDNSGSGITAGRTAWEQRKQQRRKQREIFIVAHRFGLLFFQWPAAQS